MRLQHRVGYAQSGCEPPKRIAGPDCVGVDQLVFFTGRRIVAVVIGRGIVAGALIVIFIVGVVFNLRIARRENGVVFGCADLRVEEVRPVKQQDDNQGQRY